MVVFLAVIAWELGFLVSLTNGSPWTLAIAAGNIGAALVFFTASATIRHRRRPHD